jgi:hypothetical protein
MVVFQLTTAKKDGNGMRYLLLIYQDEAARAKWSQEEVGAEYEAYNAFGAEAEKRGLQSGLALLASNTATTVKVRNGKTLTTDGPFAETKEQLGGYYVLNCKDLDEAIEVAAKIPGAKYGSIEIRPVMEFE